MLQTKVDNVKNAIIQAIEDEQLRKLPDFRPGDTIRVHLKILEGDKERVQAFEGVCIARRQVATAARSPCAR